MQLLPGPQGLLASPARGRRASVWFCDDCCPRPLREVRLVRPGAFPLVFTSPTSPPAPLPRSLLCTPPAAAPALEGQPSIHAPAP